MENFEGRYPYSPESSRLPDSPQAGFRQLAQEELNRLSGETTDPLVNELVEKGLAKIDLKNEIDLMYQFKNDVTVWQPKKLLGSLVVVEQISRITHNDPHSGFNIKRGDPYIDIHIPPLTHADKQLPAIADSFTLLAHYIEAQQLPGMYIMGVTYEKLARASRRFGFTVVKLNLPPEMTAGVGRVYRRFQAAYRLPLEMGQMYLCFQNRDEFMARFNR